MSKATFDVPLRTLDPCFEGDVPATLCTCAADGTPNASLLSVVRRVDDEHIALSFQYFRKTKQNLKENPKARLLVIEPRSAAEYRLSLEHLRSETEGESFERLAISLSAIASQTGMEDRFKLRGADIYRVTACERFDNGITTRLPAPSPDLLARLSHCTASLSSCSDLADLLRIALEELEVTLGQGHSFVMAADEAAGTLFSIASRGYTPSGIGAELPIGEGVIGMSAARRAPLRIASMSRERIFADAVRSQGLEDLSAQRTIELPGLPRTESQLVVPLLAQGQLLGVLCVQSAEPGAFSRDDEELATVVAHQLASCMARFDESAPTESHEPSTSEMPETVEPTEPRLGIRHYQEDDSVFVNNEYLIKGVAGCILWLLLCAYKAEGRRQFTNRELRLNPHLGLPPVKDNLESRLIMLRERLAERCPQLSMQRTGRGRFELQVIAGSLELESV